MLQSASGKTDTPTRNDRAGDQNSATLIDANSVDVNRGDVNRVEVSWAAGNWIDAKLVVVNQLVANSIQRQEAKLRSYWCEMSVRQVPLHGCCLSLTGAVLFLFAVFRQGNIHRMQAFEAL